MVVENVYEGLGVCVCNKGFIIQVMTYANRNILSNQTMIKPIPSEIL